VQHADPDDLRATGPKDFTSPQACIGLGGKSVNATPATPSGGACVHHGGDAVGAAVPTSPTTICCTG
jgi:hypothetical protein